MADFVIDSLRGGMNDTDPPLSLPKDQSVNARNVEYVTSMLGERRQGGRAIDLSGSTIAAEDRVTFLSLHTPSRNAIDVELWGFAVSGEATYALNRKTDAWSDVVMSDAPDLAANAPYRCHAVSFAGSWFFAYKSAVDRLHKWDGTAFRRVGLAAPVAAPTAVDTAVAGTYAGARRFRVRFIEMSGAVIVRRGEASDELSFTPNGAFDGAIVTRPAVISEGETHWELEEEDGTGNFYRIATTAVGTPTYTDTILLATSVPDNGELADDSGDNTAPGACEFLAVDENRLLMAGNFLDGTLSARVMWTPVLNDLAGVGNSERIPFDRDSYKDLDIYDGGPITGMSGPVNGTIIVTKLGQVHKLVRTGDPTDAYETQAITKSRGGLYNSLVEGLDQSGQPCVYFLDPDIGPCRYGVGGLRRCGADIFETWKTVHIDANKAVCAGVFYPAKQQVIWSVATEGSETPTLTLVLHTNLTRETEDGIRKGFTVWDGGRAAAYAMCLFSDNVDDNTDRSSVLVPFIAKDGDDGHIWITDVNDDDNAEAYAAAITTRPYAPTNALHNVGAMAGVLVASAQTDGAVDLTIEADFGLFTRDAIAVDFTPVGAETTVIRSLDNLTLSEMRVAQFTFADPATPGPRWALQLLALKSRLEKTS